jgi:hypothetical protein
MFFFVLAVFTATVTPRSSTRADTTTRSSVIGANTITTILDAAKLDRLVKTAELAGKENHFFKIILNHYHESRFRPKLKS